jgi:TPR repeat protein
LAFWDVNNEKAIPWYKLAAGQGNTEAQVRLANIYFWHTDDFPGDYKSLYKAAAAKGDDEAECMMGVLADNPSLKADWLEKSAAQGNAEAQYSLAQIFESGEGRKQDYKKALQYYELAAEQNDPMALRAMGDCYFYGVVAEEDEKKGLKYYRKAADDGDTNSKIQLGKCYYYGWGVTADFLEAVEYFQQAISDDEAQIEKEDMHLFGGECYRLLATCHLFGYEVVNWVMKNHSFC